MKPSRVRREAKERIVKMIAAEVPFQFFSAVEQGIERDKVAEKMFIDGFVFAIQRLRAAKRKAKSQGMPTFETAMRIAIRTLETHVIEQKDLTHTEQS